jgi:RimJ/RimL family protein N-acetyltransferase
VVVVVVKRISGKLLVKKLSPSEDTAFMVSRLLYEEHIYKAVDDRLHDLWVAHQFLQDIESGKTLVFGVFNADNNSFLGCSTGAFEEDDYVIHAFLKRKIDTIQAGVLVIDGVKNYCIENKINIKSITGYIPVFNKPALRLARKLGMVNKGIHHGTEFFKNKKNIPCCCMRKDI